MLRTKDAIGGRGWNIATQERKLCDVEIEIVTFVINGSVEVCKKFGKTLSTLNVFFLH